LIVKPLSTIFPLCTALDALWMDEILFVSFRNDGMGYTVEGGVLVQKGHARAPPCCQILK